MSSQSDKPLNVEQQFLVSPGETFVSELEKIVSVIAGKREDPGFLIPASKRVQMVITELESRLSKATLTLEAIGRAEGV